MFIKDLEESLKVSLRQYKEKVKVLKETKIEFDKAIAEDLLCLEVL